VRWGKLITAKVQFRLDGDGVCGLAAKKISGKVFLFVAQGQKDFPDTLEGMRREVGKGRVLKLVMGKALETLDGNSLF
jgi:hypothetical protein